jgi:hypothetical protein
MLTKAPKKGYYQAHPNVAVAFPSATRHCKRSTGSWVFRDSHVAADPSVPRRDRISRVEGSSNGPNAEILDGSQVSSTLRRCSNLGKSPEKLRKSPKQKYVDLQEFCNFQNALANHRTAFTRQRTLVRSQHRPLPRYFVLQVKCKLQGGGRDLHLATSTPVR